jgi:7-carboxy-7-deazaguanine synthase
MDRDHELVRTRGTGVSVAGRVADHLDEPTMRRHQARLQVLDGKPTGSLMVHEIYASIQGESTFAGLPCTFVRLTGCPLRCRWCDTPHAFTQGKAMSIDAVVEHVESLAPRLVEVTGGEPLSQGECLDLLTRLADADRQVLLETSGAISIEGVDPRVIVILDLKCPSSGEMASNDEGNLKRLRPHDEVKFVIGDRADFDWSVGMVRREELVCRPVLFSPVHGELSHETLAGWILETGLPVRLQVALHKVIWGPDVRGV